MCSTIQLSAAYSCRTGSTFKKPCEPPKHAFWLNIAEIELSVLARQDVAHNIATVEELCRQVQSWQDHCNQHVGTVNWPFRTADARIKRKRLYPVQQLDARPPEPIVRQLDLGEAVM
ncbi:hypothetical protein [Dictyobacter formicarum]|uniref:Uncharacterized protein n=1 Tax=Dictyobacter formicarum TaxID=2778368 RepID=A0ABQ3V9Z3_9CHLR|nr:hypothetical protein [Dictyobacter formicarum]GHO82605.1 hypothetical protein KSZ_06110 [Dictyobacter formicarum]